MRIVQICCIIITVIIISLGYGCRKDSTTPPVTGSVVKDADIYYIAGDTMHKHTLDVYHQSNSPSRKVLLFIPGGAWRQGDKNQYDSMAVAIASIDHYTVVVANYRLSNSSDGSAVHPDHVTDVAFAFKWVMENIRNYGGDPDSVFVFGQSAGGHLVSLLASDAQYLQQVGYSFRNIRGVISMSGAYTLSDLVTFPLNPLDLGADDVLMYKSIVMNAFGSYDTIVIAPASPSCHVNDSMPPFLLIYTELDMPGFALDGEHFYSRVRDAGGDDVSIFKLYESDYSAETWQTATALAAAEPMLADYIGHYAEVVAINKKDYEKPPATWIVNFIRDH